jgi:L-ascorbate metabolism protein UlaG (beta-lactamase superfamily)
MALLFAQSRRDHFGSLPKSRQLHSSSGDAITPREMKFYLQACPASGHFAREGDMIQSRQRWKMHIRRVLPLALLACGSVTAQPATVNVIPLGSHAGEFCRNDRALLFVDPTGVRILWDAGRTIAGGSDPRMGAVHVMLLSHAHTDHIGDVKPNPASPGTCANPGTVTAAPNSNFADIAAAQNAAVFVGGELATYLGRKIQDILGPATATCDANGLTNEQVVPRTSPCTEALRPGGSVTARMNGSEQGVRIAVVPAFHSNGIAAALTDSPGVAPGTAAYAGSENGYILTFSNGLTVYLTGDTGIFGDMSTIVRKYYHAKLMVVNLSDVATMGPDEAAFATTNLVRPRTVIPSHINEAATTNGAPTGARMQRFLANMSGSPTRVVLPLSGVAMQFDGNANCLSCQ